MASTLRVIGAVFADFQRGLVEIVGADDFLVVFARVEVPEVAWEGTAFHGGVLGEGRLECARAHFGRVDDCVDRSAFVE